ncbi:MAG: hypothetical protein OXC44_02815, partial [Proteobacteria bacterium]|nr:hypothetical protein [Pseudomonadota bacterium]
MLSYFYLWLPLSSISVSYMMISRLVTTIVLFCLLVVVPHFHSIAFGNDGLVKQIHGKMPNESSADLSAISSQKDFRVDDKQIVGSSDVRTQIFTMDKMANTYYHKPTIDMVWFVDHPMNGLTPDNSGRSYVKDEIKLIIRNLKDVVDLRIALYALSHPTVMFDSQEIKDWNRKLKDANDEDRNSKDRFFQFGNFFEPSQLLKNAYLWLTFGIPDRNIVTGLPRYRSLFRTSFPRYNNFYKGSFSYTNGHANGNTKRDGFFRDPRNGNVRGIYKKIFVFVTSEDSRRYSPRQLNTSLEAKDLKGSIRIFMGGTHPAKFGSKILFSDSVPGAGGYSNFPSVFSYWSFMALLGGVYKYNEQPSLDALLEDGDMASMSTIKEKLKPRAADRIKKSIHFWNINKYSLHMKNEDFINEIMGKKEAYEKYLNESKPVRAMFPAENNAEINEYLYTLENLNNKENNIEKIDVWSFVFDGFSSGKASKENELIACSVTSPPPPPPPPTHHTTQTPPPPAPPPPPPPPPRGGKTQKKGENWGGGG